MNITKPEETFDIDLCDYTVRRLSPEDAEKLQELYEKCPEYFLVEKGQGPTADSAAEDLCLVPPGKSPDDKLMFGIFHLRENLVGALDVLRGYPDETTWWIGLLLLEPDARSRGIGRTVVQGFKSYVLKNGGRSVALGVVADNPRALEFWRKLGFAFQRRTEPRPFKNKTQAINVMRQLL